MKSKYTQEQLTAMIIDLEIKYDKMVINSEAFNKTLPVLRKIQKLRAQL